MICFAAVSLCGVSWGHVECPVGIWGGEKGKERRAQEKSKQGQVRNRNHLQHSILDPWQGFYFLNFPYYKCQGMWGLQPQGQLEAQFIFVLPVGIQPLLFHFGSALRRSELGCWVLF